MALVQLIYVSTAVEEFDATVLDAILESSVRHNALQHITGLLLYTRGTFMQVLEGEEADVKETYGRICADPRHHGVTLLFCEPLAEREFAHWSMGYRHLSAGDADEHPGHAPFFKSGFDAQRIGACPGIALDLLRNFARS